MRTLLKVFLWHVRIRQTRASPDVAEALLAKWARGMHKGCAAMTTRT
jgi:hypothetical protein